MLLDPGAKSASSFMMIPASKEFNLNSLTHLEPAGRDINNGRAALSKVCVTHSTRNESRTETLVTLRPL
jgi:hypothetical protein